MQNIDLIYYGVNSKILYKLWYYSSPARKRDKADKNGNGLGLGCFANDGEFG